MTQSLEPECSLLQAQLVRARLEPPRSPGFTFVLQPAGERVAANRRDHRRGNDPVAARLDQSA